MDRTSFSMLSQNAFCPEQEVLVEFRLRKSLSLGLERIIHNLIHCWFVIVHGFSVKNLVSLFKGDIFEGIFLDRVSILVEGRRRVVKPFLTALVLWHVPHEAVKFHFTF